MKQPAFYEKPETAHLVEVPPLPDADSVLLRHPATADEEAYAAAIVSGRAAAIKDAKFRHLSGGKCQPQAGVSRRGRHKKKSQEE